MNAVRCLSCGDTIESKRRHDHVTCSCGDVFVDGGADYNRRGWKPGAKWVELVVGEDGAILESQPRPEASSWRSQTGITVLDEEPNSIRVRMRCSHCGEVCELRSGEGERVFRLRHRACGEATS